jgi:hypothetical protein
MPIKRNEGEYESDERECRENGVWIGHASEATEGRAKEKGTAKVCGREAWMKSDIRVGRDRETLSAEYGHFFVDGCTIVVLSPAWTQIDLFQSPDPPQDDTLRTTRLRNGYHKIRGIGRCTLPNNSGADFHAVLVDGTH